jgi:alpha-D-ribose 1-methylphosphonate 5-phosphate C-P lyase
VRNLHVQTADAEHQGSKSQSSRSLRLLLLADERKGQSGENFPSFAVRPGHCLMNMVFWWYDSGMKIKTSVTLSKEVVAMIDKHADGETNRSAFIELAVRTYLQILQRRKRDQQDLRTINRLSEKLNKEAEDVLGYQRELRS